VVVDPEALIVLTWSIGRADARLFDSAMAWMSENSGFLDMTRLERIVGKAPRQVRSMGAACSASLVSVGANDWQRFVDDSFSLAEAKSVFVAEDTSLNSALSDQQFARFGWLRGKVSPQAGAVATPDLSSAVTARLLLRKLIGTNARAEVLTGALFGRRFFTREIANTSEYSARSVQMLLREFEEAGLVQLQQDPGRPTQGWPSSKGRALTLSLFPGGFESTGWIDTSAVSLALIDIWQAFETIRERQLEAYPAESVMRDALLSVMERFRDTRSPERAVLDVKNGRLPELIENTQQVIDTVAQAILD
jgi:hypothetical protein